MKKPVVVIFLCIDLTQENHSLETTLVTEREALKIVYGGASGEIEISGPLGLFEAERTYHTEFIGNLKDGELNTIWQEGDRIKIRLQKLEN